ncbi:MAG: UDP-N-acetylmuramate dehydrogenase [Cyanobacteria bacterium SIG30]|nr:UDP-N-acetylmuramate dehydrogenase [Cyanobacteria bacterium SIG30]
MSIEKYEKYNLKNLNTYKIESIAEIVYFPKNEDEVIEILKNHKVRVIGAGSNVLFSSQGISEPLLFMKNMDKIEDMGDKIYVEAGVMSPKFSKWASDNDIEGFEFLSTIPSSIGGNIYMNAGAYGCAISDLIVSVNVYDTEAKKLVTFSKDELNFSYRNSIFAQKNDRFVILSAIFEKKEGKNEEIKKKIDNFVKNRQEKQPSLKTPNAGSVFKNPQGFSAGELIEKCGFKGKNYNGAMVSDIHANFILNINNAKSCDIVNLMHEIQNCVYNKFNIKLVPEIIFIGKMSDKEEQVWQQ